MSYPERPSYQKPTKSSSSPSVTPVRRNPGGNVPLVRGLSPVRSPYYGRVQELETQRSHNNPLYSNHSTDGGHGDRRTSRAVVDNASTKIVKDLKENFETEEPWKVHVEKGQYGGKPTCTTPGKTSRVAAMQFTTPPKPIVKRKILSEHNRDAASAAAKPLGSSRRGEDSRVEKTATRSHDGSRVESEKRSSETSSDESDEHHHAPMVSIEELQKRIQRFLQTEGSPLDAPVSPVQCTESIRRFSGVVCGESPEPGVEDVVTSYHPVFSPYSPRPEFLRARTRSPSPAPMEAEEDGSLTHDQSPIPTLEKSTTPTSYDPKNNFLSPRPQYLRYRPLRRLELLRRSADALLDLDLDSPATDADSVRVESEKGTNESQEIQSEELLPSVASDVLEPSTQDAETDIVKCKTEERQLELDEGISAECEAKSAHSVSELSNLTFEIGESCAHDSSHADCAESENAVPEAEEDVDAEETEILDTEHPISLASRVFKTSISLITVIGLILLVLAASGSPGMLPESLHHNELSGFWRTSEQLAPVRKFLQSVEGLWKDGSGVLDYPVNQPYMEGLRVNLQEVAKAVTSFDAQDASNAAMHLYAVSTSYTAPVASSVLRTSSNVKKWVMDCAESYISRAPDVDEWDWVPDYDFVVAKDVFDWAEGYKAIMAKVDSWEIKSIFQSYIDTRGAKSIEELISENSLESDLDVVKSIISESKSPRPEVHLADLVSDVPSLESESESPNIQFTQEPDEEAGSGEAGEQVLLESLDQENTLEGAELTTVILGQEGSAASSGSQIEGIENQVDELDEAALTSLSSNESGADMIASFDQVETSHADLSQHASEHLPQEASLGEKQDSGLPSPKDSVDPQDTRSQESAPEPTMLVDGEPKLSSSSVVPSFRLAMNPAVLAAAVTSVILATVIAIIFTGPGRKYTSLLMRRTREVAQIKQRSIASNTGQISRGKLPRTTQRTFNTMSDPHPVDAGTNYMPADSPLPTQLSSEYIEQFSTPHLFVEKASSTSAKDRNSFMSPERSFKQVSDKDSFMTPEVEVLEDSALGRFTALVPVIHNEGTEKEEVKLTPVRRSSRIRSRLQSPCSSTLSHFSYSPE
ncbi:hypothetical protein MPTK1_6g06930 [Marchantia polymorpha subsp. ruderalis]|uniref:Uncharacterized protein n=2 Tax=Marchantia polymorpha TaxID=3197 RepID=A0AAF6BPB5_MARPO|nr:hypothetical protein MARPO_0053s0008 [Marchantia polymorpha]BBN13849.1 hypothetical protein Mp_6g06930 [Marchantia polymorpha subsp. ruderalis]|eukprot:PTQ38051.1 hypothetical protein MARPO_0053s0008 [Marchantia polymorpha]